MRRKKCMECIQIKQLKDAFVNLNTADAAGLYAKYASTLE